MRKRWSVALGMIFAVHAASARGECRMAMAGAMPLSLHDGKLLVQGKINGETATMIFDTGASTTFLTNSAIAHLDLRALRGENAGAGNLGTAEGVNGGVAARGVEARSVDFGGLRARNFAFLAMDRDLNVDGVAVDGLLSADLLAKYDIDVDFPGRRLKLFYPQGDCSTPAVFLHGDLHSVKMQTSAADNSPRIDVTVGNLTLTAMIDTGAAFSLIQSAAAARLGLKGGDAHMVGGLGRAALTARRAVLPSLNIGDLELQNWTMDVAPAHLSSSERHVDILIGLDVLMRMHPWISYSSGTLVLQMPPAPSPGD